MSPEPAKRDSFVLTFRSRLCALLAAGLCLLGALSAASASAATPAWSPVAVSGPTNLPPLQSETQRLGIDAEEGTFTLTADHVVASGQGNLPIGFSWVCDLSVDSGSFSLGQAIVGVGIPAGTTITAINESGSCPNSLTLSSPPFKAAFTKVDVFAVDASAHTGQIPFDAEASLVEAELDALSTIGGDGASVMVKGGPGGKGASSPYLVTFGGSLANKNVPPLGTDATSLAGSGHSATDVTTVPGGPGTGEIAIYLQNVGGESSSGPIHVEAKLPEGVKTSATPAGFGAGGTCSQAADHQSFTCESPVAVPPGSVSEAITAPVVTDATASGTKPAEVTVEGGDAEPASYSMPLTVSSTPAEPGIQTFTAGAYNDEGKLDTRAGGHPYSASTAIFANTFRNRFGNIVPVGEFKDIVVDLPPGFLGNPIATPQCPEKFLSSSPEEESCPPDTIVGRAVPILSELSGGGLGRPVYDVEAPFGYPGKFYFNVSEVPIHAVGSLRSDGDYGLTVSSLNTAQIATVFGSFFTFWGTPANSAHDNLRCLGLNGPCDPPVPDPPGTPETAFLTNPVDCAREAVEPPITRLRVTLWQSPLLTHEGSVAVPPVTGCENLHFEGNLTLESSETRADSPASFTTSVTVPSEGLTDPGKLTTPEIRNTVVQLPKGVVLNAAGADGLQACSEAQIGLKNEIDPATGLPKPEPMPNPIRFDKGPNTCPEASKIGSGELKTALLAEPLHGALYLAAQGKGNPFGSLFAIYLVIEDPRHGIFIKLPGRVEPDKQTGQMTVSFENLPQLPFTSLKLDLKGGERSALATPQTCGTYTTRTTFTPWSAPESGPPTVSDSNLTINSGANGAPCKGSESELPFGLGFEAGTTDPMAGAHSPFAMRLTRPDGAQNLDRFELTTPEGFTATLRGIPYCSDADLAHAADNDGRAEQVAPSCPAASQVGTTEVGAGAGPRPFFVPGKVYLAGPYKGAQLSVAAIVPAVAGPFDLGTQVVRAALRVNPATAQVTTVTDPLPKIIDGVPLRIRDVRVELDKPGFTLNPTDCSQMQVSARAFGTGGATSEPSNRFQVGGCGALGFKPKLFTRLYGGIHRGDFPRFRAVYVPRPGDANLKDLVLRFPRSEFIEQGHFRTICTRVQYAADGGLGGGCPKGSIYGHVTAVTPLLDQPLSGPVFLRSSNHSLPDVVFALHGQVDAEASVRIDSKNGGLRASVEDAPDVPLTKVIVNMQGHRKGLFVNSRNICVTTNRAKVRAIAHNGRVFNTRPALKDSKCRKAHKKSHKRHHRRR